VLPDAYADVVRGSNGLLVTVDVFKGGVKVYGGLPIDTENGGSITVSAGSATRRSCNLTLPPFLRAGTYDQVPTLPDPMIDSPFLGTGGHEVQITHSLVSADGSVWPVPVGRFRVDDLDGSDLGREPVSLVGVSRESYVVDDTFIAPRTVSGASATAIITQLIRETLPQAMVSVTATHDAPVQQIVEESDRWGLILTLAQSIGAQVYCAPDGRFVIADAPTVDTQPVWRFEPGPGGTLLDSRRTESRVDVKNRIAVQGYTPDGASGAVVGIWRDVDPTSPTRWGDPDAGAWGKASLVLSQPSLTTLEQCRNVAAVEGAKRVGATAGLDLSTIPHAGLEATDIVDVVIPSSVSGYYTTARRHMIDSFTLPLTPGGAFPVRTRDLRAVA